MIGIWTFGLLRRRGGRVAATAAGIAAAVALLACLGSFLASAQGSMTARATRSVAVDWQIEVQPGAEASRIVDLAHRTARVQAASPVGFAHSSGFTATDAHGTQTTGPGVVLGMPQNYRAQFPGAVRTLVGADGGVLVAQQTAANLHVGPGDTVQIGRAGLPPVDIVVDGVVDLPQADSLFQQVGAPVGAGPVAPPDNVVILGDTQWHNVFDPLLVVRPDLVSIQVHATLDHGLSQDPASAYTEITGAARNFEARSAGGAVVGNNLGAALDAVRGDAAYAEVLFLFLGLPAVVLGGLLTATVVAAGGPRRRKEQALLRARGAKRAQLVRVAASEAVVVGAVGSVVGLGIAALVGLAVFGSASFGARSTTSVGWAVASGVAGMAIAVTTVLAPAWADMSGSSVTASRTEARSSIAAPWTRFGLAAGALAASGALFWVDRRAGYQLVVAPEGVPTVSVSYWTFVPLALLWAGSALLAWCLSDLLLSRGRRGVGIALRPLAGELSQTIANSIARQRHSLSRAIVLLALAVAFAGSVATFNATYRAQAEVDAQLTNGADVTVTELPGAAVSPDAAATFAAVPGVRMVEPIQHRFAYIGAELQDLYGVNPTSITDVTTLQDNYFQGGSVAQLMGQLAAQPDSVLVSAETVKDFQLQPGDTVNLRLQNARTHQLATVPFHFIGVVAEFPTAPKDSFFVANAAYIAERTGSDAVGAFLVDTGGQDTSAITSHIQSILGTSATATDIATIRGTVGSSLTAVDLAGLTRVELGFGVVLAAAAGALVLGLGLTERRRSFAIAGALGASRRQLRSFVVAEAGILAAGGLLAGGVQGWAVSHMLVAVLTGVFDPPPTLVTVPWAYVAGVVAAVSISVAVVSATTNRLVRRSPISMLREL